MILDNSDGLPVPRVLADAPVLDKQGLCAEFFSIDNAPPQWHVMLSHEHGESRFAYDLFCESNGCYISKEYGG